MLQAIKLFSKQLNSILKMTHPVTGFLGLAGLFVCIALSSGYKLLYLFLAIIISSLLLFGIKNTFKSLLYSLFTIVFITIITTLTYHMGSNVFLYINDKPITLEGVEKGLTTSLMIVTLMMFFRLFNLIIDTGKIIFLFGKFLPVTTLMISMVITFTKRYSHSLKETLMAQEAMGISVKSGNLITRMKNAAYIYSGFLGYMLENSIDTAVSMKARGYNGKNIVYNPYKFSGIDLTFVILILLEIIFIFI